MNFSTPVFLLLGCVSFLSACEVAERQSSEKVQPLSPEASLETMVVQDGYQMELVAAEPLVEEPVLLAYDGNGRMYVAEMLTYMLDVDGSGQMQPTSRIKRLEDTDGDGQIDTTSVFADGLLLPRMIQPVGDGQILVRETNTLDLLLLTDTNADGIADQRRVVYEGGPRGGNLEHQPSGLIYNIDNWMYVTYTDRRYKFDGERIVADPIPIGLGQWGLAQDAVGRLYYSTAGGEDPAFNFQFPSIYGKISIDGEKAPGFNEVFPISTVPDVQGGQLRVREDGTLNHFSGGGGQGIYLGASLGGLQGDYFLAEPVGNLIRRATVDRSNAFSVLSNIYQSNEKEFIASSDPSFRPVWIDTAPDGSLMIVDMYRGIVQESEWTREGSYIRGVIEQYGLDKIVGRGRIYRVTQSNLELGPQPRMYSETPVQLLQHLAHPSFWWRINAQKILVLSQSKEVVPELQAMASEHENPSARLHALWTLEGLGSVNVDLLKSSFVDEDVNVRMAAIRISEQFVDDHPSLVATEWISLAERTDLETAQQLWLSANVVGLDGSELDAIRSRVYGRYEDAPGLMAIDRNIEATRAVRENMARLAGSSEALFESVERGRKHYETHCFSCHREDGKGLKMGGDLLMAPSLVDNPRVEGNLSILGRIAVGGLQGPIHGQTYGGVIMAPLSANDDQYIADVLTFVRNSFGNSAPLVAPENIASLRQQDSDRTEYWTLDELEERFLQPLADKSQWKLTASHGSNAALANLVNGEENPNARWTSEQPQQPGMWVQIELPELTQVSEIQIVTAASSDDYARGYKVSFSEDGEHWREVAENFQQRILTVDNTMVTPTRFIRLTLIGEHEKRWWSINEIDIYGSAAAQRVSQ